MAGRFFAFGVQVTPAGAFQLFVGITLLALGLLLVVGGRRRPESVTLATYLGLVAANFLLGGLGDFAEPNNRPYLLAAAVALALDPFYLLAFVTLFPFRRRTPRVRAMLALVACTSAAAILAVLAFPDYVDQYPSLTGQQLLLIGNLVVAYVAAWQLTIVSARDAPTPELRRRAIWMNTIIAVVVLPRLGLVWRDLGNPWTFIPLDPESVTWGLQVLARDVSLELLTFSIALGCWVIGTRQLRAVTPAAHEAEASRASRVVLVVLVALLVFHLAHEALNIYGKIIIGGSGFLYGARWLVFAVLALQGLLLYEVLDLPRGRDQAVPVLGAGLAGVAAYLLVNYGATYAGESAAVSVGLGFAAGLGAMVPGAIVMRALARTATPTVAEKGRLELYRAALEAAWAEGAPDPERRRQLDRERRTFRVSREESDVLEHVVATELSRRGRRLVPGDEAAPGLVLEGMLGEGSHGRVFAARRYPGGERVVVKEMRTDRLGAVEGRRRLLDEVRALRALEHPRIVGLLDVDVRGGSSLLVMAHVEAEPLSRRLGRGALAEAEVHAVVGDVLSALDAAHARGVVHRDVKPSNILLGRDGRAFLTDFGIAALQPNSAGGTAGTFSSVGGVAGTFGYMAPEQATGSRAKESSDLYAVGLVAFEALTGRPALDVSQRPLSEAIQRTARPRVDLEAAPAGWRSWLARALEPDPAERFASAAEMRDALPGIAAEAV